MPRPMLSGLTVTRRTVLVSLAAIPMILAAGCNTGGTATGTGTGASDVKIGFIVKSATEPWFQSEWQFADEAAKKYGFTLVKLPATDADQLMSALDNLAAQGAQGVIVCAPDTKLGPSIVAKCEEKNLKLMSVDDRLVDAGGKPLDKVAHLGISASEIGKSVGEAIAAEIKTRGWNAAETGAAVLTVDEIETCRLRTDGAAGALEASGFNKANIYRTPWKAPNDINTAVDAANIVLTQHPNIKHWVAFSSNDDGVLGFVRASEQRNIAATDVIGIGINGTSGKDDLKKATPTGFYASILLSPKTHGFGTAEAMYKWIKEGTAPAAETYTKGTLIDRKNFVEALKAEGLTP